MEADALQAARAGHHGLHDTWVEFQNEVIEGPFQIAEARQYLKMHDDGLWSRPVVPVRGSSQHQS